MQPRLIIAAAFFVLGALIAIPALSRAATQEQPTRSTPAGGRAAATPTPTGQTAASEAKQPRPSRTPTPTPSRTATARQSPPDRPSRTPTARQSPPDRRATPTPSPTPTPAVPITARAGKVGCPGGKVAITVTNKGQQTEDYAVTLDEATVLADRVPPRGQRKTEVEVRENESAKIEVLWGGEAVLSVNRKTDCVRKKERKDPDGAGTLPRTGPDDSGLFAKAATGVAAMVTGVIIFWYGSIWPRRRTRIFE
jgi:hypothetical protein